MDSMEPSHPDCIVTYRGGILECRHQVHAAVVDSSGRLLYTTGDPSRVTLWRSAAKPAQAVAILETGCMDHFGLDEADLALICASHSMEDRHLERARSILDKIGASETDLSCGPHLPIMKEIERQWIKRDLTPTKIHNNCSGKHAGMLAGTKAIGATFEGYHLPEHPMQLRVKRVVEGLCRVHDRDEVKWGNDGCNLPAPATSLPQLGILYATFAHAADASEAESERMQACRRVFNAMVSCPELVAGEGRFCTALMRAYDGSLFGKVGAEGCYGIGVRDSAQTRRLGAQGALGIAVKVEDGNMDILYSAVVEILEQLCIGRKETREEMSNFRKDKVLNTAGVVAGHVDHVFELRPTSFVTTTSNGVGHSCDLVQSGMNSAV